MSTASGRSAHSLTRQPEALRALVERLAPGGRLVRTRRLRGGLSCRMDVLGIERADGSRTKVSLRRFVNEHRFSTPEHVAHEFDILRLVETAGIRVPQPILLDADGEFFGVPLIVLSYLPGKPHFATSNLADWTEGLAKALRTVHEVTSDRFDLSSLSVFRPDEMLERMEGWKEESDTDPLSAEICQVLKAELGRIDFSEATLIHNDYWPGNTVWYRGRLAGVADWSGAELGDPRADIAQCRIDLVISHNIEVADAFREDYERLAGQPLKDIWYFDLFRGVRALMQYEQWLVGYYDIGLRALLPSVVGARLRAFLRRALAEGRY